jgi:antitoxin YefM
MTTTSMSLAQVKARLSEVVGRVTGQHERVTVTVHGRPAAVLIAPEDLEALEETLAILSEPETLRRLETADAELAAGDGESEADLAAAMERRGRRPVA